MGGVVGATSGKFILIAATLLLQGRIDNRRTQIEIVPGARSSTISSAFVDESARKGMPGSYKIGLRASYFYASIPAVEPMPASGSQLRIGRDILDTHPIEIDFVHRQLRILLPGEMRRAELRSATIPITREADGTLKVLVSVDGGPAFHAALDLSRPIGLATIGGSGVHSVRVGEAVLKEIDVDASATPAIGLLAFARSRVIFDLQHDRILVGA